MIRIRNPTKMKPETDALPTKGGIVIGMKREGTKERIYYISEDSHLLCIGATRSGKSRWTDGDADEEPVSILTNFIKSIAVAVCFPTMYSWMADIITDMTTKLVGAVGINTAPSWETWVSHIAAAGIVSAIFALIFVAVYFILYFQFLMRGLEIMILRVGMPLACVGLIDNDKGVFKAYLNKFFQSMLAVMIQLCLCRLGVNLMLNLHTFWGVACMVLAVKAPKFLQDFLITTGSSGGAIVNNAYHSVRLVQMLKKGG